MFCHFCHSNKKSEEFAKYFKISIWLSEFQYITSSFAQRYFTFDDPMRGNLGWKVAWALTGGLEVISAFAQAQSPKYDWDQGSEERAQGSEEWDQGHKAFEPESGIRFFTRSNNLLSQYFPA